MSASATILVVDDSPQNARLLNDLLESKGYRVLTAGSGAEAIRLMESECPDLVLLDVVMPSMSGYEVCAKIRGNTATATLPVVMMTARDAEGERVRGLDAGADDFLAKPINLSELLARVRSLLRIKRLHDRVEVQAHQLADWNQQLEQRVREQVVQLDRLGRLRGFFSPQVCAAIVNGGGDELLKTHRREVVVVFLDLRGFTAFSETCEPEEVNAVLAEYHRTMGRLIMAHEGVIEHFAGDGMMIFFNDPIRLDNPAANAFSMTLEMRQAFAPMRAAWNRLGYELDMGMGVARGYATLGAIGFEGRWDYGCIGSVANLAARLCGEASGAQILTTRKTLAGVDNFVHFEPVGQVTLKGIAKPVEVFNVTGTQ